MIFDHLDNAALYPQGARWGQAIAYLKGLTADSPEGEFAIDGERLFARVMSYETRLPEAGVIESHRRYTDIQVCLSGVEGIDLFDRDMLTVKTPYSEEKDVTFYQMESAQHLGRVDLYPGYFAYLLPRDAHRPQMFTDEPRLIKKAVVKLLLD